MIKMSNEATPNVQAMESDDDHNSTSSDTNENELNGQTNVNENELTSNLYKWTNYIHGWQERHMMLKNGILSYYKNKLDTQFGCRGSITLKQCTIVPHDLDDCRFDIRVNDCVWYLRADTNEERTKWINALEEQRNEYSSSGGSLKRHGSLLSINSVASQSIASSGSFKKGFGLREKLAEMETFKDILCKQVETLQVYFDACANSMTKGFEPYTKEFERESSDDDDEDDSGINHRANRLKPNTDSARIADHAAMALDFKGEAFTFKATTVGILTNFGHCIDLMQQNEEKWRKKLEREIEKRKKLDEQLKELKKDRKQSLSYGGPDFEEGPHSTIKEDQFFDAIDNTLDNLELEEERRIAAKNKPPEPPVNLQPVIKHKLWESIEKHVQDHLKLDRADVTDVWELFSSDGEMKMYRREVEENGVVLDPLKAVHTVRGVTGHEMCHHFWSPAVRMEWEHTLDSTRVIETIDKDTLIFHQIHKRVWPAAQRDAVFWSHIRSMPNVDEDGQPDWIVVNQSIDHDAAILKDPFLRAVVNIALTCETKFVDTPNPKDKSKITRKNLQCKITYVAQINPGGWAPASALRTIFKREYPKFLKRFTKYVIESTQNKPILF